MIYVIGSGPSGVSAAAALLRKGCEVTMLDAGLELEPDREALLRRMAEQDSAEWDAQAVSRIKENMQSGASGILLKYAYGSDFPYRETDLHAPRESKGVGLLPSMAKGGLSNVWGAAVLPYLREEFDGWPVTRDEMEPHYRSVLGFMKLTAGRDDLEERFPLYCDDCAPVRPSAQAESFLEDLRKGSDLLKRRGFLFGYSRIAVAPRNSHGRECAACGLCMYGCPYGLIYNSASTLDGLRADPRFKYVRGVVVEKFAETSGGVEIAAHAREGGERLTFTARRVYVAAGVLASTRMLLESTRAYERALTLKDSQYFLLPLLRYRPSPEVFGERLHTLSQAFVELFDPEVSEKSVHLQVYTYNELYRQAIQTSLGPAYRPLRFASDAFLKRFLLIQGFLHSDLSATVEVKLREPRGDSHATLLLEARENARTAGVLKKIVAKLRRNRSLLRGVPLSPLMKVGDAGRSFHSGGTLPMRREPGEFETDVLGRPHGFSRVHVVDSSVFPTINASPITFTVMANAHRIASVLHEGD
jgi:choline dehydrogenase-like flavoprotein